MNFFNQIQGCTIFTQPYELSQPNTGLHHTQGEHSSDPSQSKSRDSSFDIKEASASDFANVAAKMMIQGTDQRFATKEALSKGELEASSNQDDRHHQDSAIKLHSDQC